MNAHRRTSRTKPVIDPEIERGLEGADPVPETPEPTVEPLRVAHVFGFHSFGDGERRTVANSCRDWSFTYEENPAHGEFYLVGDPESSIPEVLLDRRIRVDVR